MVKAVNTHVENQNLDTRSQQKCSVCCPSDKRMPFFSKHTHLMLLLGSGEMTNPWILRQSLPQNEGNEGKRAESR